MRLSSHRYALIGLAFFCSFLYSAWRLSSFRFQRWRPDPIPSARLVVFGDSWSDNGISPTSASTGGQATKTKGSRAKVWTDALCSDLDCEHHENYAQSLPVSWTAEYDGAVVDNENLHISSRDAAGLADLGDQLDQWMDGQKVLQKELSNEAFQARKNRTIFVVFFGVWDIWHASRKEMDEGLHVIERSVDLLLHRIGLLAEYWGNNTLRIVVPLAADPTFLPGWRARLHPGIHDTGVRVQRSAVSLVEKWNKRLEASARALETVQVYLFDTNAFITDQIRDQQMYSQKVSDAAGWGKRAPTWEIVDAACIGGHDGESTRVTDEGESMCPFPDKYLFWDDMHLGAKANNMMAGEISQDIAGNFSDAWIRLSS